MAKLKYHFLDGINDLAALFSHRWIAIPLITLLIFKVVSLAPITVWYLVPLIFLTLLFSIRVTAAIAIREPALIISIYTAQHSRNKP